MKKRIDWSTSHADTKNALAATRVMGWKTERCGGQQYWRTKGGIARSVEGFNPYFRASSTLEVLNALAPRIYISMSRDRDGWFCYMREHHERLRRRRDIEAVIHGQPTMADAVLICALRVSGIEVNV